MALGAAARQQQQMMRQAARARQTTSPQMLPAPLKGWNTRDAWEAMDPQDAIVLDNWQPDFAGVRLREGSQAYAQLQSSSEVLTLAVWQSGAETQLLAAQADGTISRVDTEAILGTGFQTGWWQTAAFRERVYWVNGRDEPQVYDGTTLADAGFAAAAAETFPLDVHDLIGVATVHNRLFFWTGNDPGFWYTALPYQITGDLRYFPLAMTVESSAPLVNVQNLTYDGGLGIGTYTVFVMADGTTLTYSGSDPS